MFPILNVPFELVLFYILSTVLVYAAFRVITAKNPVTAALHLILTFFTAAMLWVLMEAEFLALLLVLVYVGAVMVLFLFVVMMFDFDEAAFSKAVRSYLPVGFIVGAIMIAELVLVLFKGFAATTADAQFPSPALPENNAKALGELMYTQYPFAIQVGAMLLLVGMIAAVALTLRTRTGVKRNNPADQVRVRAKDRLRMIQFPKTKAVESDATEATAESSSQESKGAV